MSRYACLLALGLALAPIACTRSVEDPMPVQTGSYLVYRVVEQLGDRQIVNDVRLDFTVDDDVILARIQGPGGEQLARLDRAGVPSGELAFGLEALGELDLKQLYLPAKDRRQGVLTKGGRTTPRRSYEGRLVWPTYDEGRGHRYYDEQLGVLIGWHLNGANGECVAKLVDSR